MCRKWLLLLIPLFITAGTSTLDEEANAASSSKIEDIVPGKPDNTDAHQLFKRRFTYTDFSKYNFARANGRIPRSFLRNPYPTVVRSKRSNSGMIMLLKSIFVNHNHSEAITDPEQMNTPVELRNSAINLSANAEYDASKEENWLSNTLFNRIDETLNKLNNKLEAMEKRENSFIMFKLPVAIEDYDMKSRVKRETNDMNEDRHDDDMNIAIIAKTKPNNQQPTTKPKLINKIVEKVEGTNNTVALVISHNETNKNESASLAKPPLDTNKTEAINNKEIDRNKTSTELRDDTRKSYKPKIDDLIHQMEEILDVIHIKLSPLKIIKETHSKDEEYKVGYIIANLESNEDTIEKLLKKIKMAETLSRDQAENILDKVTISSMVVSNLMNFLEHPVKPEKVK